MKCKEEVINPHAQISLIDDDFGIAFELFWFDTNIKKEACGILESLFSFLRIYEKRKSHNMLCLMLNPKFKSLCLISSLLVKKKG